MKIGVIGAGAFGTALAMTLASRHSVLLWARDNAQVAAMESDRSNTARLPGLGFPDRLTPTADLALASRADVVLLAVPMQQLRSVLVAHRGALDGPALVACCKGMELGTGLGPVAVIAQELPGRVVALMTGPSFADDIARGLPTALTLACADPEQGRLLQGTLNTATMRLYRSTDVTGAELGGALKNVMAIACGAVIGSELGLSARAALMTRGFAEMVRLALALGAQAETLSGLSGFGDLALTCTSDQSRNYRLGLTLGRGLPFDPAITVEGAATARAVDALARERHLDLPIVKSVVALLDRTHSVPDIMASLLARPLKEE